MPASLTAVLVEAGRLAAFLIIVLTPVIALLSVRRGSARRLLGPIAAACLLVIPFAILEVVNRRGYGEPFPFQLFAMMWLMAFCFAFILTPTVRSLMPARSGSANRSIILPGLASLLLLAWGWIGLIRDQMPCFLGVPLCD